MYVALAGRICLGSPLPIAIRVQVWNLISVTILFPYMLASNYEKAYENISAVIHEIYVLKRYDFRRPP